MRSVIKYITLLLAGGVIIPLCQLACACKPVPANAVVIDTTVNQHNFSFIADVAAKLLPVLNIFK